MEYRPQSPDLSSLVSESGGYPQLGQIQMPGSPSFSQQQQQQQQQLYGHDYSNYHAPVTSFPQSSYNSESTMAPSTRRKQVNYAEQNDDEDDFMPEAPAPKKSRRVKQEQPDHFQNGEFEPQFEPIPTSAPIKSETTTKHAHGDPTLGCQLKTSFPVARIKRIMQADEDIGKVAQVTPTVVSRALELFMTKLISAAAHEARGPEGPGGTTKGPRRVLAQHLKRAIKADEQLDFLEELTSKVPDAPVKAKKEPGSDSEDTKPKKKGKKRKDSGDDF